MYGIELTPPIAREMNVTLVSLYEEGAVDAVESGLTGVDSDVLELCFMAPNDTSEGVYLFPSRDFGMRQRPEGTDERIIDAVDLYEHRIRNIDWYRTIGVRLNDWNDDKIGRYKAVFYQLGNAGALAQPRAVQSAIQAAKTTLCYDGVPLLSTSHPVKPGASGGTTYSNLLTQSAGLTFDTFGEAFAKMMAFPIEDGHTARSMPTHLVIPPEYIGIGLDICTNANPSGLQGGANPWLGRVKLKVVQDFAGTLEWGLVDNRSRLEKPFVLQDRETIQLRQITDPSSPIVFLQRQMLYSNDGRFNVGVGYPTKIIWSKKS